jgi:hypothetical protein
VCSHLFAGRISDEQKSLSDGGEKDIGKYRPALTTVFEQLSEAELQQCEDVAVEWNTNGLPDEVQRKWVTFTLYSDQLVTSTQNVKEYSGGGHLLSQVYETSDRSWIHRIRCLYQRGWRTDICQVRSLLITVIM